MVGPHTVVTVDLGANIITVRREEESALKRYNLVQVKPFISIAEASTAIMDTLYSKFVSYASDPNKRRSSANVPGIQATEIIHKDDPRAFSPKMKVALLNEVRDLLKRGTFEVILKEEFPDGPTRSPRDSFSE